MKFILTYDYLCPFARNANEHAVTALRSGVGMEITFLPFSLAQSHVEEGEPAIWGSKNPLRRSGILALAVAEAVREHEPERFLDAHLALFALRHDQGGDLRDAAQVERALTDAGVDAAAALAAAPAMLERVASTHQRLVDEHQVWGVPTFIGRDRAVFVRFLDRPEGDEERARQRIQLAAQLLDGEPMLHEFKQVDLTM
jgi:protein-disulfide isomerase-like protein with CxxC motif